MIKRLLYSFILLLLLADIGFSFIQYLNQPLDGDMAWNLIPSEDVKPILENPFGISTIINDQTYANPNRFFCHWMFREYLLNAPLILQKFSEPIDSVYLACAISKISIQILIILLLAITITGSVNLRKLNFMLAAVLVTPLFQTNGYRSYMGIIDPSTTYTFFYALPLLLLLIYFLPFILQYYHRQNSSFPLIMKILWIPLAFIVSLSGPLNPGIVLTVSMLLFLVIFTKGFNGTKQKGFIRKAMKSFQGIPPNYWFFLLPVSILSLYSLFLGTYNSITIATQIPLAEMYLKLPAGIYYQFTQKLGFPVLFSILALNATIIHKHYQTQGGQKILRILRWIGIFSLCYILLLPLGGYRIYRPFILRYDTIMPITLFLIFAFGASTIFLLNNFPGRHKRWYIPIIIGVLLIFTFSDEARYDLNQCERNALTEIQNSSDAIVVLDTDCSVVAWEKFDKPEDSELNAELLTLWGITERNKLYYHR